MIYYIGIDGGGTKTAIGLFSESLELIKKVETSTVHPMQVSFQEGTDILSDALKSFCTDEEWNKVVTIGAGFGGYGNTKALVEQIDQMCASVFSVPYVISSDAEIALIGALNNQNGILLIAGTGSIGFAKIDQQVHRVGGWGYQLGDEGSAYWIANKMLQAYSKQVDGRMKKSPLKDTVTHHFGLVNPYDLVSHLSNELNNDRTKIADLSRLAHKLLSQDDFAMRAILEDAAVELAEMANTLGREFQERVPVSYLGGVWQVGEELLNHVQNKLAQHLFLQPPQFDALYGAALRAKEMYESRLKS